MSLKLRRIHYTGISNLDFRTKNDINRIKLYQPYHESKPFGMQGISNYKLPSSIHKELFSPTKGINEGKFIKNEMLNPRVYEPALFYKNNLMKIKPKAFLAVERSKQLDTSEFRGGGEYNGDSMMISETNKKRREIKLNTKLSRENLKHKFIDDMSNNKKLTSSSADDKSIKKCKSEIVLAQKVNKEKLYSIRNKILNRLRTHDNPKAIFIKWQNDYLNNRELSIYDLHKIINDLGIPINYNESLALISSVNKRNTDKLNYEEFKSLLLDDDIKIDFDLSNIPYNNESIFEERHKKEEESNKDKFKNIIVEKSDNYLRLQRLTRNNHPDFLTKLSKTMNEPLKGSCDLPTFKKVMKSMKIPTKCQNDEILNAVFEKYKIPESNLMNYEQFIEGTKNINEQNDFFRFQNGYLGLIKNKLEKNKEERKRYNEILLENERMRKKYLQSQLASMRRSIRKNKSDSSLNSKTIISDINKSKKYFLEKQTNTDIDNLENELNNLNEIEIKENNETDINNINKNRNRKNKFYNHYQPSLDFINHVFKDNKLYNERYYKSIDELSPMFKARSNNDILQKNVNDLEKNKFEAIINSKKFNKNFLSNDTDDDAKRFKIFELSQEEKKNKIKYLENSLRRKYETNKKWNDKINFQQQVSDINNSLGQIKRTESLYRYERKIQGMNNIL